ncbi:uncharacterized protein ACIQIH_007505 isoform 1-T1 [Cyanocitta cristata]
MVEFSRMMCHHLKTDLTKDKSILKDVNVVPHIDKHMMPFEPVSAPSLIRNEKRTVLCSTRPLTYPQRQNRPHGVTVQARKFLRWTMKSNTENPRQMIINGPAEKADPM